MNGDIDIIITRHKVYRSRFATGPGPAWKWFYDATTEGGVDVACGYDSLLSLEAYLKRKYESPHIFRNFS